MGVLQPGALLITCQFIALSPVDGGRVGTRMPCIHAGAMVREVILSAYLVGRRLIVRSR